MITKIPGPFVFTSYRQIQFLKGQLLTSMPQYKKVLYDILMSNDGMMANYKRIVLDKYNISNEVPKERLFI